MKIPIRDITQIAIFTAIIVICAQIRIPLSGGVPFTLQTTGVALAGIILGAKKGVIAVCIYILLGAAGVPVFNGLQGGIGIIAGHTGGFILSFPLITLSAAFAARKQNVLYWAMLLILGFAANLAIGMVFFAAILERTIANAFAAAVAPFLLTSLLQIGIVIALGKALRYALIKSRITI
ncbi:MAG: biotin transporter BioY [Defluviitaleaceae bacterium]|nr:biotin transporter BioY [Defluviitaleaceae bacterium]